MRRERPGQGPRIISPSGGGPPMPSGEELLMVQYQGLSQFWERYGLLMEKTDENGKDQIAADAFRRAADYLKKTIDIAENSMKD